MAATDVVLRDDAPISQAGPEKAEVGSAEVAVARVESVGPSDKEPTSAADPYARPRGFKSARIGSGDELSNYDPCRTSYFRRIAIGGCRSSRHDVGWT